GVGLSGNGVLIANVDSGVQNNHPDLVNRLVSCSGVTCGGSATSSHGTHTAGIMAADGSSGTLDSFGFLRGLGQAPGANLVEQVYSPWFTQPGGMLLLMSDSYDNGALLSGNSWGPAGSPHGYDDDTLQVDIGARDTDPNTPGDQPLLYVRSIMNGNGGTSSQGTPDEAKNIFTIGSTKMQNSNGSQILDINDLSSNSAHGPCLDGRLIPHMVAPGCRVDSCTSGSSYTLLCGTSMASPHVSGAAAVFIEYYRSLPDYTTDPSVAMTKAAFIAVAHDLAGNLDADGGVLGHPFDRKQGWGRMDLEAVVDPQVEVRYFDNPLIFDDTGEEWMEAVSAADPTEPLRVMLVWTDAPGHGLGGSTPAWNNDLDLVVESGADSYRGNNFAADGWSQTGGAADIKNNTEGVFIGPAAFGVYNIRVIASDINSDALPNSGDSTDQDFAVVCYNCGPGGPQPPRAWDGQAQTAVATPVNLALDATDDGLPDPPATMTFMISSLPGHGDLTDPGSGAITSVPYTLANNGGQVEYAPEAGYWGTDGFEFMANDGGVPPEGGDSNAATMAVIVGGPDFDPVANDVSTSTARGVATDVTLSGSDPNGDPLTFVIESLPTSGTLSDPGSGQIAAVPYELVGGGNVVTYTPHCCDAAVDTFTFTAHDLTWGSNAAVATVTVGGPAWDPVAYDLDWSTPINTPTDIPLSGSDPNDDPLTYYVESLPNGGTLTDPGAGQIQTVPYELVGSGNVVTYDPPTGQNLEAVFDFSVRDATAASNLATVTITVGGPQVVYYLPMDSDPGWSTEGGWAFGQPTGSGGSSGGPDPTGGHTGNKVYGYNLNGDYANDMPVYYLTTTALDFTGATAVELRFSKWLGVEGYFDDANVQVSNNGTTWTTIWEHSGATASDSSWSQMVFDISDVADHEPTVYVRWGMGPTDRSSTYCGWNIDDVEIIALVAEGNTCDDGVQNQGEDRIDCGGPCPACACLSNGECDDSQFCTGVETCDAFGDCQPGSSPCGAGQWCNEAGDACVAYGDGDFDFDGDIDVYDFSWFQGCFGLLATGGCEPGNITGSGTIELDDFALFVAALGGPQ
ncbi:MAG: S8 family serine peptidase, partial [Planctomycetota bacterium]